MRPRQSDPATLPNFSADPDQPLEATASLGEAKPNPRHQTEPHLFLRRAQSAIARQAGPPQHALARAHQPAHQATTLNETETCAEIAHGAPRRTNRPTNPPDPANIRPVLPQEHRALVAAHQPAHHDASPITATNNAETNPSAPRRTKAAPVPGNSSRRPIQPPAIVPRPSRRTDRRTATQPQNCQCCAPKTPTAHPGAPRSPGRRPIPFKTTAATARTSTGHTAPRAARPASRRRPAGAARPVPPARCCRRRSSCRRTR